MQITTLTLLTTAAIGVLSIGSATAMPFNGALAALGESHVQDVRVVCNQFGRCYNTRRSYRYAQPYVAQRYYDGPAYYGRSGYYGDPGYGYGGRGVGIGVGPFGFMVR